MAIRTRALLPVVLTAILLASAVTGGVLGQEATPAGDDTARPLHIHSGTCDTLGGVVFPLTDVTSQHGMMMATPDTMMMGTPAAGMDGMMTQSVTTIDVSLDDILAAEHAINVHESADNIQNYIACGDLTGTPEDGMLEIALGELNDSGSTGMATLIDNGDGTTSVTVMLMSSDMPGMSGMPGSEATTDAVTVEISGFAYAPASVTIPVGGSVTWTNLDSAPHTATARDRDALQSGRLNQGDSFTQTFDTPGTYEYFCEFHGGMQGVVIVE